LYDVFVFADRTAYGLEEDREEPGEEAEEKT